MTTESVSGSPHMNTAASLLDLAEQVSAAASSISQYLRSKSLNDPTFSPTSPGLPEDPEIENAKESLLVASKALTVLATNPLGYLRDHFLSFIDSAAYRVVVDWKIAHILSTAGTPMHISELAEKSGADEHRLLAAMKVLANSYVFAEVKPNVFAHNSVSIHLTEKGVEGFVTYSMEVVYYTSEKYSESMRKHGSSTKSNETAFNLALSTDKAFWEWIHEKPEMSGRFNACMKPFGAPSYARLRTVYPWRSLGDSLLVDLGGGNGYIAYQLAEEAPELKIMIQDVEQAIAEAKEVCPDSIKPRCSFHVHNFFETQPVVADVYFLRMVLHFLNDEDCVRVLKCVVPAMKPGARILVAESIFPVPGELPNPLHRYVSILNWNMSALLNARERTFAEYEEIFHAADRRFRVKQWGKSGGPAASEILEATLCDSDSV
ncbi:S-adenosyl-L-methionine-dependent methyltransferase [Tuber indicum]|nr:S-adenosyl-L-methionine-dependent methyltransferase [Tuber indicum]